MAYGYFWEKLSSYLKSETSNLPKCKFLCKNVPKMRLIGTKDALCGNFQAAISKTIVIFQISALEFVKNEFLAKTVNFGMGFAFSKGYGSRSALQYAGNKL